VSGNVATLAITLASGIPPVNIVVSASGANGRESASLSTIQTMLVKFTKPVLVSDSLVYSGNTAIMTYTVASGVTAVQVRKASDGSVLTTGVTTSVTGTSATVLITLTENTSIVVVALENANGRESAASDAQLLIIQYAKPVLSNSVAYSGNTASMTYTVASGVTALTVNATESVSYSRFLLQNNPLRRAQLLNLANGPRGTISIWWEFTDATSGFMWSSRANSSYGEACAFYKSGQNIAITLRNSSTVVGNFVTTSNPISGNGNYHLFTSWDLSTGKYHIYVNGVKQTLSGSVTTGQSVSYNTGIDFCGFGGALFSGTSNTFQNGRIGLAYINYAEYVDPVTSLNKFVYMPDVLPVSLGANGSLPTGQVPAVFINSATGVNSGNGGDFPTATSASTLVSFIRSAFLPAGATVTTNTVSGNVATLAITLASGIPPVNIVVSASGANGRESIASDPQTLASLSTDVVLDANGTTVKYVGNAADVPTSVPWFIYANPRGTGPEWFAVVKQGMKTAITNYAGGTSAPFIPSVFGQTSPVPFNNIVTTLMTNIADIFAYKTSFNSPIASWDTSNIITMESVFMVANSFNQPIDKWYTGAVTNMSFMFFNATSFNRPIGAWNTSNVTTMRSMFNNAIVFNQPIGAWDTSKVTNMNNMFSNVGVFNQNISAWNVASVTPKPPTEFSSGSGLTAQNSPFGVAFAAPIISNSGIVTYSGTTASMTYTVATGVTAVQVRKASDNTPVSGATSSISSLTATITVPFTDAASPLDITVVALANAAGRESAASATQTLLKQFAAPTISGSITYSGTTASMTYTVASGVTAVQVRRVIPTNFYLLTPAVFNDGAVSPLVANTNLLGWNIDNQFLSSGPNRIYEQMAFAARVVAGILNVNEQADLTVISGGGSSNGSIMTITNLGNNNASIYYYNTLVNVSIPGYTPAPNPNITGVNITMNATTATITVPISEADLPLYFVVVALANASGRESAASATQTLLKQFAAPVKASEPVYTTVSAKSYTASMTYTVATGVTAVQVRRARPTVFPNFYLLTPEEYNNGAVSPLVANTNLAAWNIDLQHTDTGLTNRIREQIIFAAFQIAPLLNTNESVNITFISGGGSSNGTILTIINYGVWGQWVYSGHTVNISYAANPTDITGVTSSISGNTATITVPFAEVKLPFYFKVIALANSDGRESAVSVSQELLKQFAAPVRSSEPTERRESEIKYWNFISLSQTGQYQTAGSTVGLYTSSNYGVSWTLVPTANGVSANASFFSGAISSTGQYQSVFSRSEANGSNIYTSSNYGVNWTVRRNCPVAYQSSISVSSTGQYQSANAESQTIFVSSDYGVTWTPKESVRNWQGISISTGSGQYQTAVADGGGMYRSSDWGADWTLVPAANGVPATAGWYSISLSSTGQYQSAVTNLQGSIYISSNFGVNWSVVSAAGGVPINTYWMNISISSTGQYQTAVNNVGGIYISSNYGVNWVLSGAPTGISWLSIAVSSTGQYQSASMNGSYRLYFSRDYGFTWTQSVYRVGSDEEYNNVTYAVAEGVTAVKVLNGLDVVLFSTVSVANGSATFTAPLTDLNSPLGIKVVALANSVGRESAASATQTLLKQFAAPTLSGSIAYSGTTASMTYTVATGVTAVQVRKASDNTPIAATTSVSGTSATISITLTDSVSIVVVALANATGRESAASASQMLGIGFPSEYTSIMHFSGIPQPNGIAFNGSDQVIISLKDSGLQVLNYPNGNIQNIQYGIAIGSSGSTNGLFSQPGAIALDNSKNIVVADTGNKRIQMFTITGNHIRSFGSNGTGNGQFMFPSGVAVNSDNNIIVSDSTNHNVQIFSNTGAFISKFGSAGSANGQFNFASSQDSIAIDNLDNIYVVDGGNKRVQVFNKSGTYLSQKTFEQTPQAIAIDATEKIFIAYSSNVIVIHDKNWNYIEHFGYTGSTGAFEFNYIAGMAVDVTGRLHVADRNNNSYKVFGASPQTLTGPLSQPLLTNGPTYLVPAGTNTYSSTRTYTMDTGVFGIKLSEYDAAYPGGWKPLSNGPTSVSMSNPFDPPRTLATIGMPLSERRVGVTALSTYTKSRSVTSEFYTNSGGSKITIPGYNGVVSPMFAFDSTFGSQGSGTGNYSVFYRPRGIAHAYYTDGAAVNPLIKSFLLVSDSSNHRVLMYDLSGSSPSIYSLFGNTSGSSGAGDNDLNAPQQVAYCYKNKRIAIADSENNRIMIWQLYSGSGSVAHNFFTKLGGPRGSTNGVFSSPAGVAFDMDGNIVVADTTNSRIQIFNSNGGHLRTWGTYGTANGQLNYPRSVAINSVGHVIVGGIGGVQIFDQFGTFVTKFPGMLNDSSVAVDNSAIGQVIVADYDSHKIHLFTSGGTLIRTVGSGSGGSGSGNGEFNNPAAVTVDNSGRMYVCERSNHRISIFTNPAPPPPPQQAGGGGVDENVLI
jgi:surface protein